MENQKTPGTAAKIITVVILLAFFGGIGWWIFGGSDDPTTEKVSETDQKINAFVVSQEFVKQKLKSPATADFEYYQQGAVTQENDSTFFVNWHVDSQNEFGAMMRSNYTCRILIRGETARCDELTFY